MLSKDDLRIQELVRKLQDIDLRCLKRPTKVSQLEAIVRKPRNPLPRNPLPRWHTIPLYQKFPIIPCAPGQFEISRCRIGDSLFKCNNGYFDNEDPNIKSTPTQYNALHDPCLKRFFMKNPQNITILQQQGLVTERGDVPCTKQEFNKYREYLYRLHGKYIDKERKYLESLAESEHTQKQKIHEFFVRQLRLKKEKETRQRLKATRRAKEARHLQAKLRDKFHPCSTLKERLAIDRAAMIRKNELDRQNHVVKINQIRRNELRRHRRAVLEWYCRDWYAERVKEALIEHKAKVFRAEREQFVEYKRDFQAHKIRYERAILLKDKLEQECTVSKRRDYYLHLEEYRAISRHRHAVNEAKRQARAMYLMKKYGRRWLNIVEARRHAIRTYHDSLWAIRGQLRELVTILRDESGTVSFHTFIKGLVKLKPGREVIEMEEETRDVVSYILEILLESTFKEHIKRLTSCTVDFWSEDVRRKMAKLSCPRGDIINLEDFIPPDIRKRLKPNIKFEKPLWPCCGPCSKLKVREKDADWKERCGQMAHCLTKAHCKITDYLLNQQSLEDSTYCIENYCREYKFLNKEQVDNMCIESKMSDTLASALTTDAIARAICIKKKPLTGKSETSSLSDIAQKLTAQAISDSLSKMPPCKDEKICQATPEENDVSRFSRRSTDDNLLADQLASEAIIASQTKLQNDPSRCRPETCGSDIINQMVNNPDGIPYEILKKAVEVSKTATQEELRAVANASGITLPEFVSALNALEHLIQKNEQVNVDKFCKEYKFMNIEEIDEMLLEGKSSDAVATAITHNAIAKAICIEPCPPDETNSEDRNSLTELARKLTTTAISNALDHMPSSKFDKSKSSSKIAIAIGAEEIPSDILQQAISVSKMATKEELTELAEASGITLPEFLGALDTLEDFIQSSTDICVDQLGHEYKRLTNEQVNEICLKAKSSDVLATAIANDAIAKSLCKKPCSPKSESETNSLSDLAQKLATKAISQAMNQIPPCKSAILSKSKILIGDDEIPYEILKKAVEVSKTATQEELGAVAAASGITLPDFLAALDTLEHLIDQNEGINVDKFCKEYKFIKNEEIDEICIKAKSSDTIATAITNNAIAKAICIEPCSGERIGETEANSLSDLAQNLTTKAIARAMALNPSPSCKFNPSSSKPLQLDQLVIGDDEIPGDILRKAIAVSKTATREELRAVAEASGITLPDFLAALNTLEDLVDAEIDEQLKIIRNERMGDICVEVQSSDVFATGMANNAIAKAAKETCTGPCITPSEAFASGMVNNAIDKAARGTCVEPCNSAQSGVSSSLSDLAQQLTTNAISNALAHLPPCEDDELSDKPTPE